MSIHLVLVLFPSLNPVSAAGQQRRELTNVAWEGPIQSTNPEILRKVEWILMAIMTTTRGGRTEASPNKQTNKHLNGLCKRRKPLQPS